MKKKNIVTIVSLIIFIVFAIFIYQFYLSKPTSIPTEEQLVQGINDLSPEANANVIQDRLFLDEMHLFVPFISHDDKYGVSYWGWEWVNKKWKVVSINTTGEPEVWQGNEKETSTYQLVWNIHPNDKLAYLKFYLIRDRGFHITQGVETYYPKVQMEETVSLKEKSYGILQLPEEWTALMNAFIKLDSTKQSDLFFNNFFPEQHVFFGWIPYEDSGNEKFPEQSINGHRYLNGNIHTEFVRIMNEIDIETN